MACRCQALRPYGATFLIFSDYMRPPIRLAALMDIPVIFIYTHDSIGLGEDGTDASADRAADVIARDSPAAGLPSGGCQRSRRNLARPSCRCKKQPVLMALTRQAVPTFDRTKYASAAGVAKGAYIMADSGGTPEIILMGTGSEVQLCVGAYEKLTAEGVKARVVSMPCWELFEQQSAEYKMQVLPPEVRARVAVEAGTTLGMERIRGTGRDRCRPRRLRRIGSD